LLVYIDTTTTQIEHGTLKDEWQWLGTTGVYLEHSPCNCIINKYILVTQERMTLTEKANKIMLWEHTTQDDIKELGRLKWKMWKLYARTLEIESKLELNYKIDRERLYNQYRHEDKMTIKDAEKKANLEALLEHGEYIVEHGIAKWMYVILEQIKSFIIQYNIEKKEERSAILWGVEN